MAPLQTRAERRAATRRPAGSRPSARWPFVVVPLLVLGVVLFFTSGAISTGARPVAGTGNVVPEHTVHEFGAVGLHGGLISASFPLSVEGPVDAVDLTTS